MRRSGLFVTIAVGTMGIFFLRLLILDAQASSSMDPAGVWRLAVLTTLSIAVAAIAITVVMIRRTQTRNQRFREEHPDAAWIIGLSNPDLEAQTIRLGGARRLRPSFIAAFDRDGLSLMQGARLSVALHIPSAELLAILPSEVSSGTRRSPGVEIRLADSTHTTLAFIARNPERPLRAQTQDDLAHFVDQARLLMGA